MSVIRKMREKYSLNLVDLFLLLSPFVDLLICFFMARYNISIIGNVFRGGLLFGVLIYIFFLKKQKNTKILLYICIIFIYTTIFLALQYNLSHDSIKAEIIGAIKYMFYPLMLSSLIIIDNKKKRYNCLYFSAVFYSLLLIIPFILGKGSSIYSGLKSGYIGWFYSPNEISSIIGILSPFIFWKIFNSKSLLKKIIYFLVSLLYIYSAFLVGTKTPVLAITIAMFMFLAFIIYNLAISDKKKEHQINISFIILLILFAVVAFFNSNTFNNLRVHGEVYKQLENINDQFADDNEIESVLEKELEGNDNSSNNIVNTEKKDDVNDSINAGNVNYVYGLLKGGKASDDKNYQTNRLINLFLSSRDIYFYDTYNRFISASISEKIFGMGVLQENTDTDISKTIEIDFLDILFNYGIIGFAIYFGLIGYVLFKIFKYFILNFKLCMSNDIKYTYYQSVLICICISSLSGHILGAPAVSFFAAVVLADLFNYDNKLKTKDNFWNKSNAFKILKYFIMLLGLFGISLFCSKYFNNLDLVVNYNKENITFKNCDLILNESKNINSKFAKDSIDYYDLKKNNRVVANVIILNRIIKEEKKMYVTIKSNVDNLHIKITEDNYLSDIEGYKYKFIENEYNLIFKKMISNIENNQRNEVFLDKNEYFDYGDNVFNDYIISDNDIMYKDYSYILNNLDYLNETNYCSNMHSLESYGIKNNNNKYILYNVSLENNKIVVDYYFDDNYNNSILNLIEGDGCE